MKKLMVIIAVVALIGSASAFDFTNKFGINAGVGMGIPIGDMPDMFPEDRGPALGGENGFKLIGNFSYGVTRSIVAMLGFSTGSYRITKVGNNTIDPHQQKVHDKITSFNGIVRYYLNLPGRPLMPYFQGGAGLHMVATEVKNVGQGTKDKATKNCIGINMGAGFHLQPRKSFGIDVNLSFDFIFTSTDYNDINTKIFTITAGPVFFF